MFENQTCMYFHCFSSLTFPRNTNMNPPRKWRVERQASPLKEWFAGSMVPLVVFPSLSHQNFSADQRWGISSSWLPARQRCIMRQVKGQKSPSVGGNSNSGWNFSPRMSWGFMIQFDLRRFFKWVEVNHQLDQGQQKTLFFLGAKLNPLILPHLAVFFWGDDELGTAHHYVHHLGTMKNDSRCCARPSWCANPKVQASKQWWTWRCNVHVTQGIPYQQKANLWYYQQKDLYRPLSFTHVFFWKKFHSACAIGDLSYTNI